MGLNIYISGCIVTFIVTLILAYKESKESKNPETLDFSTIPAMVIMSWITIICMIIGYVRKNKLNYKR